MGIKLLQENENLISKHSNIREELKDVSLSKIDTFQEKHNLINNSLAYYSNQNNIKKDEEDYKINDSNIACKNDDEKIETMDKCNQFVSFIKLRKSVMNDDTFKNDFMTRDLCNQEKGTHPEAIRKIKAISFECFGELKELVITSSNNQISIWEISGLDQKNYLSISKKNCKKNEFHKGHISTIKLIQSLNSKPIHENKDRYLYPLKDKIVFYLLSAGYDKCCFLYGIEYDKDSSKMNNILLSKNQINKTGYTQKFLSLLFYNNETEDYEFENEYLCISTDKMNLILKICEPCKKDEETNPDVNNYINIVDRFESPTFFNDAIQVKFYQEYKNQDFGKSIILAAGADKKLYVYQIFKNEDSNNPRLPFRINIVKGFEGHQDSINCIKIISYKKNGDIYFVSAGVDTKIIIWNYISSCEIQIVKTLSSCHIKTITDLISLNKFSVNYPYFATCSVDGIIKFWLHTEKKSVKEVVINSLHAIRGIKKYLTQKDLYIFSGGDDKILKLWS